MLFVLDFLLVAVVKEQPGYYSPPDYKRGVFMFEKLPMRLQFFAEDPTPDPDNDGAPEGTDDGDNGKSEKTFTQAELNDIVKARVNRALKNKQEEIDQAKSEATKLAKMNKDQKQEYKLQQTEKRAQDAEAELARYKMRDTAKQQLIDGGYDNPTMNKDQKQEYKLQQTEKRAQDAEAELARYKMRDTAKQQLIDGGYDNPTDEDIDLIVTDKAETTKERGEAFLKAYNRIKENVRQELLKGKSPRINGAPATAMTKEQIAKIKDPVKRVQAIRDNLSQYEK